MVIQCPGCQKNFQIPEERINKSRFKARCSICKHIFPVYIAHLQPKIPFFNYEETVKQATYTNIIAISNQKGGVAKTTTSLNLGFSLARLDKKVLLIDFDAQANLSLILKQHNEPSFYNYVESNDEKISPFIKKTQYNNLYLFPANGNMVLLNKKYFGSHGFEYILKDRIAKLAPYFDYIIIDTPPSIEFFTLNALTACKLVIIPCETAFLSTNGVNQILKMVDLVKKRTNPGLVFKILITMFDTQITASQAVLAKMQKTYAKDMFDVHIENDNKIKESQIMKMPVLHYAKNSPAGLQYFEIAKQIIKTLIDPEDNGAYL